MIRAIMLVVIILMLVNIRNDIRKIQPTKAEVVKIIKELQPSDVIDPLTTEKLGKLNL